MNVIICVDNRNGVAFNHRRQSRDRGAVPKADRNLWKDQDRFLFGATVCPRQRLRRRRPPWRVPGQESTALSKSGPWPAMRTELKNWCCANGTGIIPGTYFSGST